ncbi:tetratricopeptide repeat protein [Stigmatella sp. ncwal1]|uniref:Tetratricopeptide repeat protein n=1 Tax=Stigmatella ashevillensis TaxID=2995309 RepID=A0ABT5D4M7_9BACT|nr:tetratricopeptide repeat protein [Stigmatella ashevillena]MDC0707206.1 tetratricopeptide repeat protein [Stigmatella ashevillena]
MRTHSKAPAGKTAMTLTRSFTTAALVFTTACATTSQVKPAAAEAPSPRPVPVATSEVPSAPPAPHDDSGPQALFLSALEAFDAGDYDRARKGFEQVVESSPQSLNAQFNLGLIAERQGRLADAQAAYEKVLGREPGHQPSLLNLGRLYRVQEKFAEAIRLYEGALAAPGHAHDVALLNNLTVAYRLAGQFEQAEATARRVLARSKDNPEAYKNLALVYYDQGQYRLAELVSANARKLAENDPGVYNNLGMIYLKLNERPRALAQFQKAVSLNDQFAPGYLNIGAMSLAYRDYAGAERAFARAVELDPTSYESHLYYAFALDGQKGSDAKRGLAAGEAFEKVLAMRPEHPEAVCGAGWAYAADRAGWQKALGYLDRCKALQATTPQDRQMIDTKVQGIQAMLKSGQPQPAAAEAKKEGAQGKDSSLLDKVSDEAAREEGTPAEEAPPADEAASAEPAPAQEAPAAPPGNPAGAPSPAP